MPSSACFRARRARWETSSSSGRRARKRVGYDVAREFLARHPGSWEIGFQAENDGAPEFWRRVATDAVGDSWPEELRPVPGKPHIPHDHFIVFDV